MLGFRPHGEEPVALDGKDFGRNPDYGAALRQPGSPRDAREPPRHGPNAASGCGALALAARAHEQLTPARATSTPKPIPGTEALTGSE
jgi:hypothetical protein